MFFPRFPGANALVVIHNSVGSNRFNPEADPVFVGDKVYFRSDRNGEFNLFAFDATTEAVEQLTHYDDFP